MLSRDWFNIVMWRISNYKILSFTNNLVLIIFMDKTVFGVFDFCVISAGSPGICFCVESACSEFTVT